MRVLKLFLEMRHSPGGCWEKLNSVHRASIRELPYENSKCIHTILPTQLSLDFFLSLSLCLSLLIYMNLSFNFSISQLTSPMY